MKFQTPTIGGVRKVIRTDNNVTVGTTIAEVGSNTITLAQLAQIITQIQLQQNNTGGGNIVGPTTPGGGGGGGGASIVLGPGLSGGGLLVGNVPIRLTAPIPWGLDDGGGGGDGDPGPPGAAGAAGANGATGAAGGLGPAVYLEAEPGEDGLWAIPGPQGPTGAVGATGPQGPSGSGTGGGGGTLMMWVPEENWPDDISNNNPSAFQFLTVNDYLNVTGTMSVIGTAGTMTFNHDGRTISFNANQSIGVNGGVLTVASPSMQFTPTSGAGLNINSNGTITAGAPVSGNLAILAKGNAATGGSFGIAIEAGTNTADYAFLINNGANTKTYLEVFGDGGVIIGASTTVDKGPGTLNVQNGYYLAGVPLANAPAGAHLIADDNYGDDQGFLVPVPTNLGPIKAQGPATFNMGANFFNIVGSDGMQILQVDSPTKSAGLFFSFRNGGTEYGFFGNGSETFGGAALADFTIGADSGNLNLNVNTVNALQLTQNQSAIFASSVSIKGATPPVTAGQTALGTTTTTTVITTAGGIALPALAATFGVINWNGVKYGVPLFAL